MTFYSSIYCILTLIACYQIYRHIFDREVFTDEERTKLYNENLTKLRAYGLSTFILVLFGVFTLGVGYIIGIVLSAPFAKTLSKILSLHY